MKIFDLTEVPPKDISYLNIQKQAVQVIIDICKNLQISLPAMHAALWVFHCNAFVMNFHNFDRYIYACGALLVGTKLMQSIRYPIDILRNCRRYLRKRKNIDFDEDSEQFLKKQVKKVFQAQVNIMINIGFDFDIRLGLEEAQKLRFYQLSPVQNFAMKFKQILTSLYSTEIVVLFKPQLIAYLGLKILLKAQNRSIDAMDFDQSLKEKLLSEQIKNSQKQYLFRCSFA